MTPRIYRSRDGTGLYRFSFEPTGNQWHAVIHGQPTYGARSTSLEQTHRLRRRDGRHVVCWDPMPTSAAAAQQIAKIWADCTQAYLATGSFGSPHSLPPPQPATAPRGVVDYYSSDGTAVYRFRITPHGGAWRAYIVAQPAYAGRASGAHQSHRLGLGDTHPYVCWSPAPSSAERAREAARLWAEGTQRYIAMGRFPGPDELPSAPNSPGRSPEGPRRPGPGLPPRPTWRQRILGRIG